MKKYELQNCGTVMSLDLDIDKDFGRVVVDLTPSEIRRIVDVIYENLPDKTPADKKCKDFVNTRLFPGNMKNIEVNIIPVLNKTVLEQKRKRIAASK